MAASNAIRDTYVGRPDDVTTQDHRLTNKPVFIKQQDIPGENDKVFSSELMYKALSGVVQRSEIAGIQKIRGLWRIYLTNQQSRIHLIAGGLNVRKVNVPVFDTNPYVSHGEDTIRLLVKDVPLSASDTVITDELERMKCKTVGKVLLQRLRIDGQLTDCLTGDRVIYITKPSHSLPRYVTFGLFRGRIFHPGQDAKDSTVTCSNCLEMGHHRSQCTKDVKCKQCNKPGHIARECREDFPPLQSTSMTPESNVHSDAMKQSAATPPRASPTPSNETPTTTGPASTITQFIRNVRDAPVIPDDNTTFNNSQPKDMRIHTCTSRNQQNAPATKTESSHQNKMQSKITTYAAKVIQPQRVDEQEECLSHDDEYSTAESENDEAVIVPEPDHSDLSAESPEIVNRESKNPTNAVKRKQRAHKKHSKKK